MTTPTQPHVEHAAQGWRVAHGPDIAPGTPAAERRWSEATLSACRM